jgi:tetratricopeptide (TPR) repeat protein
MAPLTLLLDAVGRIARGARAQAWRDVRRAAADAPTIGLVRFVASRLLYLLGDYRAALVEARAASDLGVTAAGLLRYNQAREIGWYHEARQVLERILEGARAAARQGSGPTSPQAQPDRALDHLLQLYFDVQHYDGAAAALDRYRTLAPGSVSLDLKAARIYERQGDNGKALQAIQRALASAAATASTRLTAAQLLVEVGAFDEAAALYRTLLDEDTARMHALEALARLDLWRGDTTGALGYGDRLSARDPSSSAAARIRAAVEVLHGNCARAVPMLDAVLQADPRDGEALLWRAEGQLRLGRRAEAIEDADRSLGSGYTFAARAIRLLASLQPERRSAPQPKTAPARGVARLFAALHPGGASASAGDDRDADRRAGGEAAGLIAHAQQEFGAELAATCGGAVVAALRGTDELGALLERALAATRGNRTPIGTWVTADGRLERLPRSVWARVAARQALELIKIATPQETYRAFDEVIARFPDSSMPLVHRGELQLWLGRYDEARADLEGAIAICRQTRWAWFGLATLDLVAGDAERALATCAYGIRVMDNTEGPVAFLYRGEAYRVLGRLDEARQQLVRSCELHPRRLSAWINLGLVHGSASDLNAQRDVFGRICDHAATLVSEASRELGEDAFCAVVLARHGRDEGGLRGVESGLIDRVLRKALAMMRGNRSSSCITYFTADGQLRHVPQGTGPIDGEAETRTLDEMRRLLTRALERR